MTQDKAFGLKDDGGASVEIRQVLTQDGKTAFEGEERHMSLVDAFDAAVSGEGVTGVYIHSGHCGGNGVGFLVADGASPMAIEKGTATGVKGEGYRVWCFTDMPPGCAAYRVDDPTGRCVGVYRTQADAITEVIMLSKGKFTYEDTTLDYF